MKSAPDIELKITDIIRLFDGLFSDTENTRLIAGETEPEYLPACDKYPYHRLIFAHGFYESALHEIAHWCIAGRERRKQVDFGYWYAPDGRTQEQQRQFERVEVKPQALEWVLSEACGRRFRISTDNLTGDKEGVKQGEESFRQAVHKQAISYMTAGLPPRAEMLKQALLDYYQRHSVFSFSLFQRDKI